MTIHQSATPITERLRQARMLIEGGQHAKAGLLLPPMAQAGPTARRLWMRVVIAQEGHGAAIDWLVEHARDETGRIEAGPCETLLNMIAMQGSSSSLLDELQDILAQLDRLTMQPLAPAQRQRADTLIDTLAGKVERQSSLMIRRAEREKTRPRPVPIRQAEATRAQKTSLAEQIRRNGRCLLESIRTAFGQDTKKPPPPSQSADAAVTEGVRDTRRADRFHSHLAGSRALAEWLAGTDDRPPPPHDRQQIATILPAMLGIIGPDQIRRLLRHGMAEGLPRILLRQIALTIAHHPDLEPDAAMALLDQLPDTAGSLRHMALLRVLRRADRPDLVCAGLARFPDSEALWRLRFAPALQKDDEAEITALIDEMAAVAEGIAAEDPIGWRARALALAERHESVVELLEDSCGPDHVPGNSNALIWARAVLAQGDLRRIFAADRAAREGGLGAMGERIIAILDGIEALGIDRADLENLPHDLFAPIIARAPAPYVPAADAPVLVVTSSLAAGGAERQTAATVNALDGFDGRRVILAAASLDPDRKHDFFLPALRENDRHVIDLSQIAPDHAGDGFEQAVLSVMPQDIARFASRLCQQIRSHRPALIHSWQDTTNIAAAIAALITGCPAVIMAGRSLRPIDRARARPYLRAAYHDLLAARPRFRMINNSRAGADDYADWLEVTPEQIGVIENGYPLNEMRARTDADARQRMRHEWGIPEDALVMGGVMRLSSVKCPERFVETAILLCREFPEFHAVLAGGGVLESKLAAMIADAGLGDRIHLIGRISPIEPAMAAFDILFLSSRVEGLPNVIIEAQALGIPVAATDVGGVAEALAPAPLGLLLPEDAPDLLAPRIAAFMQERRADPETARQLAAFVDARFSVAAMAEKTRSAYRQAMAEATRRD